ENCDKIARLIAADFAEEVLPIWHKHYPSDTGPAAAIKAARDFAHGTITQEQLAAARDAAWDARDAAWDAGDAAWDARDAAWDAGDAAWDARDAAWAAARAAARAAA